MTSVRPAIGLDLKLALKALSSARRLQILEWLKDPVLHFPIQEIGDLEVHGACNQFIGDKLGISQPAASRHLKVLSDANLIAATPRQGWIYYRRNEEVLDEAKRLISGL